MLADAKTLWKLVFSPRQSDPKKWLDAFYRDQAANYDAFRKRLLSGREEMISGIPVPENGVWVDMGGGTGANLEWVPELERLKKAYIVDLCDPLLEVARTRIVDRGWKNVEAVEGDATRFVPPEQFADIVTFSYSLTMIPNWLEALEHARRILKPGGTLGVVDFYVSGKHATGEQHGWLSRRFWPAWFERDNVFLSPHHLDYLRHHFDAHRVEERRGAIPYLPGLRVPYYIFSGSPKRP